MTPIAEAARRTFPSVDLDEDRRATSASAARCETTLTGLTAVFAPDGEFLALYEPRDGVARAVAVFV